MMSVQSTVKINSGFLGHITDAQITALKKTAEALHTEVVQAQVVPRDTGRLQNEAMFVDMTNARDGSVSIVHTTPYARRLYFHPEYNFNQTGYTDKTGVYHEGNINAKGKWFEDWMPGGSDEEFAQKAFAAFLRKEMDG